MTRRKQILALGTTIAALVGVAPAGAAAANQPTRTQAMISAPAEMRVAAFAPARFHAAAFKPARNQTLAFSPVRRLQGTCPKCGG